MDKEKLSQLVMERFSGRPDVVAKYWSYRKADGKEEKGYSPICLNRGVVGLCLKKANSKASCSPCESKAYIGATPELVKQHIRGEVILGSYYLFPNNTCRCIAGDFDDHDGQKDPLTDVRNLSAHLTKAGLPHYVLTSKSGRGYHVYVFFKEPVPAEKARRVYLAILTESDVLDSETKSFDRPFPSQDRLSDPNSPGNLIAMPFQGVAMAKGWTIFLDPASDFLTPLQDQVAVLEDIRLVTEADLDRIIKEKSLKEIGQALPPALLPTPAPAGVKTLKTPAAQNPYPLADYEKVRAGCSWCRHCEVNATSLPEPEWYPFLSIVARCKDGHAKAHEISKPYSGYSPQETDKKIANALTKAGPRTCKDIRTKCGGEPFCSACPHWGKITSAIMLGQTDALGMVSVAAELAIPDAPVAAGTMIPSSYDVSHEKGVYRYAEDRNGEVRPVKVCSLPVVISSRSYDVSAQTEFLEIAWFKDHKWNGRIVSRRTIADKRQILDLSSYGLMVSDLNSTELMRYLEEFEVTNGDVIPVVRSSNHLGWQDDASFLLGEKLFVASGTDPGNSVSFRPKDEGDAQIAKGFHSKGSYLAWIAMANQLYAFPKVFIVAMAALATMFLRILEAANFGVDLAGETSKGKTTAEVLAASGLGNPDQRKAHSVLHTWKQTDTWFERTATLLNGLPLILDDTKTADSDKMIGDMVYRFAAGKGKGRGTLTGTRETGTWQSIMISSGEQSVVDYAKRHGGVQARVLSLWGAPFGDGNQALLVKQLGMTAKANYGHAGPKVIQFILDHKEDWPLWEDAYNEMLQVFSEKAGDNSVANRLSEIIAFFAVAIPLIHAALPELQPTRPIREILDALWPAVTQHAEQADKATEAVKVLWEWAVANQAKFWGRHKVDGNNNPTEPNQGWAGRWKKSDTWPDLAVTRRTLDHVLQDFEVPATVKTWADRGWLERPKTGKSFKKSVRIAGKPCEAYAFSKATLSRILGMDLAEMAKKGGDDES